MSIRSQTFVLTLVSALATGHPAAEVYRWVDESGVTVYSQRPPPTGDAVRVEKDHAPHARDAQATRERVKAQAEKSFDDQEMRKEAERDESERAQESRRRAENCAAARENLAMFQNLGRRRVRTADGRVLRLTEDQVETQIRKAQAQIEEFCD
jgi:hypothetical protein